MRDNILNLVFRRIAAAYRDQGPYYGQMLDLAEKQAALLAEEEVDIEQLIKYIDERQGIIATLEVLNKGISGLKQEITETMGLEEFNLIKIKEQITGPGVEELSAALEGLGERLTQIKELDAQNEGKLRRAIEQTREKLQNLQEAKKVNKAYQGENEADGGAFFDQNS